MNDSTMNSPTHNDDPWTEHADWWVREFTDGADVEYSEQMLPLIAQHLPVAGPAGTVVRVADLGCGEGQAARLVAERPDVVALGVDASNALLQVAAERGGDPRYVRGSVLDVPVAEGALDAVISCLVLEHIADVDGACTEMARVLRPGGRAVLLLNHPLVQPPGSTWVHDHIAEPPEQYWRLGPYLSEGSAPFTVTAEVTVEFHHRPLHRYLNAAWSAGLQLVHMDEPRPPAELYTDAELEAGADLIPRMVLLVLERC